MWLLVADQIFMFCIVAPLVVMCWAGTWQLLNDYLTRDDPFSLWVSFALANVGLAMMAFLVPVLRKMITTKKCSVKWWLGYHVYNYIGAFIGVNQWRAIWALLNVYTGTTIKSNATTVLIGVGTMSLLRVFKTTLAPPLVCVQDTSKDMMDFPTRFDIKPSCTEHYILDTLLTTFVIQNLAVFYWRGAWGLLDLLLYPDSPLESAVASLVTAAVLCAVLIPGQILLLKYQRTFHDRLGWRIFMDYIVVTMGALLSVTHWRGVWNLCNIYIYPDNPHVRNWVLHGVGTSGSMLLLCSASNLAKGYCQDGGMFETTQNYVFSNKYIRYFLEKRRPPETVVSDVTDITISDVASKGTVIRHLQSVNHDSSGDEITQL